MHQLLSFVNIFSVIICVIENIFKIESNYGKKKVLKDYKDEKSLDTKHV